MKTYEIKEVATKDEKELSKILKNVLDEYGFPLNSEDRKQAICEEYLNVFNKHDSFLFIIRNEEKLIGTAGIIPISNKNYKKEGYCELKHIYVSPSERGNGLGKEILKTCLKKAKVNGYKKCYLETLPYMTDARKLYTKSGFRSLDTPLIKKEYYNCEMWMEKAL